MTKKEAEQKIKEYIAGLEAGRICSICGKPIRMRQGFVLEDDVYTHWGNRADCYTKKLKLGKEVR